MSYKSSITKKLLKRNIIYLIDEYANDTEVLYRYGINNNYIVLLDHSIVDNYTEIFNRDGLFNKFKFEFICKKTYSFCTKSEDVVNGEMKLYKSLKM